MREPANSFVGELGRVVAREGRKTAVETAGGRQLGYRDLWDAATALADTMRGMGLEAGRCAAVALPRGPEFVTALVACWMCGGVALLLDVGWPAERRRAILRQVRPRVIVDAGGCSAAPDGGAGFAAADAPAYLVYTSGSTGRPKGVLVSHAGLLPVLREQIRLFDLGADGRCLWVHGTGFDASLSDIGTALLAGATLCVADEAVTPAAAIRKMGITHVDLPPALLPWLDERASIRTIVIGGEVCPVDVVRRWADWTNLVCVYGPTEATICTSMERCTPTWSRPWIGAPLPGIGYSVHAPDGSEAETGELWITGRAVALGYPWEPALTTERFVNGGHTFRSGDLVRRHECGGFEFLGRIDRQFKLNGRLVCPEEVETALLGTGVVRQARVLRCARGSRAVLGASVQSAASADMLATLLERVLPAWMVPTAWDVTTAIPRTANGKPDDVAIAARLCAGAGAGTPPESDDERLICRLVAACLDRESVAADEDFFTNLGGDSLAVAAFMALAARAGVDIPADALHRGRTAAGVAALWRAGATEGRSPAAFAADLVVPWSFAARPPTPPRRILLTGATGFLGSRLSALLPGKVLPLSRANGDVGAPAFGWDEETWMAAAETIDTVVHLAADVRLFAPYEALSHAQVAGTREVLRFCATGRPKTLHHASTLAVFVDADPPETLCLESDLRRGVTCLHGGYAQAKWVSEQLVLHAMERGLRAAVHRLGLLGPCTRTGTGPRNDWLTLALPGLLERSRGMAPDVAFDLIPVDHAARILAWLIARGHNGVFHIAAPRPTTLRDLAAARLPQPCGATGHVAELAARGGHRSLGLFKCTHTRFDRKRTERALVGSRLVFPEIDAAYLRTCMRHATLHATDEEAGR